MKYSLISLIALYLSATVNAQTSEPEQKRTAPKAAKLVKFYDAEAIKKWAICSWSKAPVTTQNYMNHISNMNRVEDTRKIPFASPEENFNARLNSVCGELITRREKNAIGFGIKKVKQRILLENKPDQPGLKDQKIKTYICSLKLAGKYVYTEMELDKPTENVQSPDGSFECYKVEADGSLTDA